MQVVQILDYGAGNLFSVKTAMEKQSLNVLVESEIRLASIDALVIPGVGAFGSAMDRLRPQRDLIIESLEMGITVFGICLGMQVFFESSEEDNGNGLGILQGSVNRLPSNVRVPHMGWNTIRIQRASHLLEGLEESDRVYFAHSYHVKPEDNSTVISKTDYGCEFASAVEERGLMGVQFHPEKSGDAGRRILQNFAEYLRR